MQLFFHDCRGTVPLKRTVLICLCIISILLLVYGCCILTTFLAGATLVAHVDPYSGRLTQSRDQPPPPEGFIVHTEEKAKVVAFLGGIEFIQILAALAVLHRTI